MESQIISGNVTLAKVMRDGTIRFTLDVSGEFAKNVAGWNVPDMPVAVALLTGEAAQAFAQKQAIEKGARPYASQAQALHQSGFFRAPKVFTQIGTDAEFLSWIREQPCCLAGKLRGACSGVIVPAHVRRVASGAGTAIKPPYSAVPLCDGHHQTQHTQGEDHLGGPAWFDAQRIAHVSTWAWERLKNQLGFRHWYEVPPAILRNWAADHDVLNYLPQEYR